MIERGWLVHPTLPKPLDPRDTPNVEIALARFLKCKSVEELREYVGMTGEERAAKSQELFRR
jgi:hypothetical protein